MEITPRAANRLSKIMALDQNPNLALRIQVESGGCHGFQYVMSLTTLPPLPPSPSPSPSTSEPAPEPPSPAEVAAEVTPSTTTTSSAPSSTPELREDDTVFAFVKDDGEGQGDKAQEAADAPPPKIVLDGPSLQLLRGSKVDYTMELIGSQFKIVDNPHATSSCGCGSSFDIKDF
ncbi:[4Fe-4S] proteins maturation [Diatrype stigma]|uniref:[4Fe-4S] proteins maturation n=1 Tax=Diatrype stigma TaxID=117547 RepID=A0AAN9UR29_9PEZI